MPAVRRRLARLLPDVLADPSQPTLVAQPIVDLARGAVAGYELLSRFPAPGGPDDWFAAAGLLDREHELEARVVARALRLRDSLPDNCFLSINVGPHLLGSALVQESLDRGGDLHGVVLELTEHVEVRDPAQLLSLLAELRARGARIALDDAGTGFSGLQQLTLVRPEFVKLDRTLVSDIDSDEVKLGVASFLGELADRLDAWLIAEGVERIGEIEALSRLGVPLVQGYATGRPALGWSTLDPSLSDYLVALHERHADAATMLRLLEDWSALKVTSSGPRATTSPCAAGRAEGVGGDRDVVVVDSAGHPVALLSDEGGMLVATSQSDIRSVLARAMTRPRARRLQPVVVIDDRGTYLGVVRVERMVDWLVRGTGAPDRAAGRLARPVEPPPAARADAPRLPGVVPAQSSCPERENREELHA